MPRVGTPGKPLVTVRVGVVVLLIQHLGTLAAGKVEAVDSSAIPQVGDLLAVGAEDRLECGYLLLVSQLLLLQLGSVGKGLLIGALDGGLVEIPLILTLRGVDEGATVGAEGQVPLLLRSIGDPLRGAVLDIGDIDIAMDDKGVLLIIRRELGLRCACPVSLEELLLLAVVGDHLHG